MSLTLSVCVCNLFFKGASHDDKDILGKVSDDGDDIFEKVSDDAKDILEKVSDDGSLSLHI